MRRSFTIDCFPESTAQYAGTHAIVAIDVIRATTTAVTAVATGRRCFPVPTLDAAFAKAAELTSPLLAGELKGDMPEGFHMNNSPAELEECNSLDRPLVLLSTSGTQLIHLAGQSGPTFLACFRNYTATAEQVAGKHPRVALIGAGSRGEFREEDQACCARIAELLESAGYAPEGAITRAVMRRWRGLPLAASLRGKSAAYLIRSGQSKDLDFIRDRTDDFGVAVTMDGDEVRPCKAACASSARA